MATKSTPYEIKHQDIPGSYAKNVDFEEAFRKIFKALKDHIDDKKYNKALKDFILLVQLANGMRISEAIEACKKIIENEIYELQLEALKGGGARIVRVPPQVPRNWISKLKKVEKWPSKDAIIMYSKRTFGINTHALRHAFITYLARKGVSPQLIARLTGHKKLDMILTYTSKAKAEDIHKKILEELEG